MTGWPQTYDQILWGLVQEHNSDFALVAKYFAEKTRDDRFIRHCVFIDPDPFTREMCQIHYRFLEGKLSAHRDAKQQAKPAGFSIFDQRNLAVRLKSIYDEAKACVPGLRVDGIIEDNQCEPVIFGLEGSGETFNPLPSDDDQFGEFRANFIDLPECSFSYIEGEARRAKADEGFKTPCHEIDNDYDFWTHTRLSVGIHS